jgi:hypothetical protein
MYRCGKCNKYATFGSGLCLLCNAPLIPCQNAISISNNNNTGISAYAVRLNTLKLNIAAYDKGRLGALRRRKPVSQALLASYQNALHELQQIRTQLFLASGQLSAQNSGNVHTLDSIAQDQERQTTWNSLRRMLDEIDGLIEHIQSILPNNANSNSNSNLNS